MGLLHYLTIDQYQNSRIRAQDAKATDLSRKIDDLSTNKENPPEQLQHAR